MDIAGYILGLATLRVRQIKFRVRHSNPAMGIAGYIVGLATRAAK
jgi:hypothetical protein